ncbi:protein POLAR-like 1 isoform X2 [Phragmites australis]|uniref:protein POLAR-like 1 isoform X2 n=1 Tax=Phragmites australis TaxID=29695 RepID=UPI002D792A45|nr:protein POLAR-like 1 isoform X2 [Phragmites australis]
MASSEGRKRRIVDYLNDGEELGVEGAVGTPPRSPAAAARSVLPRFRWARLVRLGRKGGSGEGKEEVEEVVVEKGEHPPVAVSTSGESATASDTRHSGLGVGLSLVFLLAKTSDEFNKMVKVRTEMEALLKEIKHQVGEHNSSNGHDVSKPRNPESTTSSCVTDRNEHSVSGNQEDQAASSGMEVASYEKSSEDGGCCGRMDVLEEEFHAELERLQANSGSETPSFLPEEEEHDSEPSDDIADYRHGVDDDLGEVAVNEEDNDDDETEFNGVSAIELERRLHELLHERNRDRIEELEAALRCAEKKLVEKEMEICLWKDTAKFALRQDNELQ